MVIQGSRQSYGDDMGAFLCFMAVRLLEMWRILRNDGSIYLHCDPTASHYLKELMDSIFGRENFRNEIIWCYALGGSSKKMWSKKHDNILFYSKTEDYYFKKPSIKATSQLMKGQKKGMLDWWVDIPSLNNMAKERTGYPTQKPLELYERILKASSNKNDIVLDPFCGCATTCVAAEKLNRQWIGIDIWDKAHKVVIKRLQKEGFLAMPGEERHDLIVPVEGEITYSKEIFKRDDGGMEAVPFLEVTMKEYDDREKDPYTNKEKKCKLLERDGSVCQGCGFEQQDERYFELDHKEPRSAGGSNLLRNRILLCSPCNKLKNNLYTILGLRKENKKLGHMKNEDMLVSLK